jgi:RNA recognition motif-containing protein
LPNDIDDIQLFNIFKDKYPSVHHVSIMTENGESKGYGFIQFINKYDYEKCLKEMDGYLIKGKPIIVRERKKKKPEEKGESNLNNLNNVYKFNKLNMNNMNNMPKNVYKNSINQNQNINNNNNNLYNNNIKESNTGYFYKYNNKINPLLFQQDELNNEDNEEDEDLSSSNSSTSNSEKRKFSDNLDLILNDDHYALNKKIQESVDKMFEHYKYSSKNNEEFNMIIYYGSNKCSFSEDFYF